MNINLVFNEKNHAIASRAYLKGLGNWSETRIDSYLKQIKRMDGPKRCVKGIACGNSCIAPGKACRIKGNPQKIARLSQLLALPAVGQSSSTGNGGAQLKNADQNITPKAKREKTTSTTTPKRETMASLKAAVLKNWNVSSERELKNSKLFKMATAGDELNFKSRETWAALHRRFIGVPMSERNQANGPKIIRGLDVTKNFRPWHTFNLDPKTAKPDDIKKAFLQLAKIHHPDHGGDPEVFQRLKLMRDSLLALYRY